MPILYTASAASTGGGREGHVETGDRKVSLDLAFPAELGGSGQGSNPEQLVAMGYAACFSSALDTVVRRRRLGSAERRVVCNASLHHEADGYSLSFEIVVALPSLAPDLAEAVVADAHATCPYSRAFRNGAPATVRLEQGQLI
jgi:osmotically inducible protein OsmC